MRAIICAQGGLDPRWTYEGREYLSTPKHLLRLADDEPTLHRTVRQLRERGVTDIIITAPPDDPRYQIARTVTLDITPHPAGMTLITGTAPLWSTDDRTAIMFGDCWYSDRAVDVIVNVSDPEPHYVRRLGPSKITGCAWDEPLALSIPADRHERVLEVAEQLVAEWTGPKRLHMWQHFCALWGIHRAHKDKPHPHQTDVNDFSDDIDKPEEFRKWMGRYHAGAPGVVALMPWRDGGCQFRFTAHRFVTDRYRSYGVPVIEGTSPDGPFNRSAAINAAARHAGDWEVAVIVDADTFIEPDQMWCAARQARTTGQVVLAYQDWVKVQGAYHSNQLKRRLAGNKPMPPSGVRGKRVAGHVSSAVAVPRSLWDEIGGFDERFVGWGAEDRAFHYAAHTFAGSHDRIHGDAIHLWHPPAEEKNRSHPLYIANRDLGRRYKAASGLPSAPGKMLHTPNTPASAPDPVLMRRILTEPGGPLAADREVSA